jgi:hypothetical protein
VNYLNKKILSGFLAVALILPIANIHKAEAAAKDDVIKIAEDQLGVPYNMGGTTRNGFDCSGFVQYVFNKVDIDLPRTTGDQYRVGETVTKKDLEPGDMVFFKNTYKQGISHSGIYIGHNDFISATSSKGIAIDSLDNSYWSPKFVAGKRVLKDVQLPVGQYHDVTKDNDAYEAIATLSKTGIINGFENSYFKPELAVTRGQAAAMLNRKLNLTASSTDSFSDVSSNMEFEKDIKAIKAAGIIEGYHDGTFRPHELLTRAQLAVIMDRSFNISQLTSIASAKASYNDLSTSYWAYDSIIALKTIDETDVFNHSAFRANDHASRADFAAAMYGSMNLQ